MRARIFAAFLLVALAAFFSNLVFEHLIRADFDDLRRGSREDDTFLITAATEGAYAEEGWDRRALEDAVLWALMLGYEIKVLGTEGSEEISTESWLHTLDLWRERRLTGIGALPLAEEGTFVEMPLFLKGERIGTLSLRDGGDPFSRRLREEISYSLPNHSTILYALTLLLWNPKLA